MLRFFVKFLMVAVAGSVIVYVIAPRLVNSFQTREIQVPETLLAHISKSQPPQIKQESKIDQYLGPAEKPAKTTQDNLSAKPEKTTSKNGNSAPSSNHQWGVIKTAATPVFNQRGQLLRKIEPGTIVEITESQVVQDEKILTCNIEYGDTMVPNVIIRASNVQSKSGQYSDANAEDKELMTRLGKLLAQMDLLKKENAAQKQQRNPYANEYTTLKNEHAQFWKKVKELTKKRDTSTGDDFMKYGDELRAMKGEDIRLAQGLEKAKQNYQNWEKEHPVQDNPELSRLKSEIDETVSKLKETGTMN